MNREFIKENGYAIFPFEFLNLITFHFIMRPALIYALFF